MNIDKKLRELEGLQDSITHMNEKGPEFSDDTRRLVASRELLHRDIVLYVTQLEEAL